MLKSLMLASAIAIAAPALAQTTAPAAPAAKMPPASASAATGPATATPTPSAPPAPTATATPSATPTPETPTNSADAVTQVVERDWAKYDVNTDGVLSKEEFGAWMAAIRTKNPAENQKPEDVSNWTNAAFAQADKDKSGSLTKMELEAFLRG